MSNEVTVSPELSRMLEKVESESDRAHILEFASLLQNVGSFELGEDGRLTPEKGARLREWVETEPGRREWLGFPPRQEQPNA